MRTALALLVAMATLTCACGSTASDDAGTSPTSVQPSQTVSADPTDLVGTWTIQGPDIEPGTMVLGAGLTIDRPCGLVDGVWLADPAGRFAATTVGWSTDCEEGLDTRTSPEGWLARVRAYLVDADTAELLDEAGALVADLSRVVPPSSEAGHDDQAVQEWMRSLLSAPAPPVPHGMQAATREQIVGSWVAEAPTSTFDRPDSAGITVEPDGSWSGTDGCNGVGGVWVAGDDGWFRAAAGLTTLIGCDNVNVNAWLDQARLAALDGDWLVLVDESGAELGRFTASESG